MTMAMVIVRDLSISGRDRWKFNERAKASPSLEKSKLCRVSARPKRSLLTITGLALRIQQRMPGNRTSITATRTTTIRITTNVSEPSGGGIK